MYWLPITLATLLHHELPGPMVRLRKWRNYFDFMISVILVVVPPFSPAGLLRPMVFLGAKWPRLMKGSTLDRLPDWLVGRSGPFGRGCGKVVELISAWLLLVLWEQNGVWPSSAISAFHLGPPPTAKSLTAVLFLSIGVNAALSLWSSWRASNTHKRDDHVGLSAMVEKDGIFSKNKSLSVQAHCGLLLLAIGNAICEEGISRGFFMRELEVRGTLSPQYANVVQATAFGFWHYHGIPSGTAGVVLTFVYGVLMGLLRQHGGGLFLPIIAHSIADYFIFAVIARQRHHNKTE